MRMLHFGLRVSDLEQSLAFYSALGYAELGSVPQTEFGSLTMLQLPDDPFVSLELVHHPERPVEDIGVVNHLVVQVDDLDATIADLAAKGVAAAPPAEPGPRIRTSWLTDPDGYRIELVQWPPGHPAGMTAADFVPDRASKASAPCARISWEISSRRPGALTCPLNHRSAATSYWVLIIDRPTSGLDSEIRLHLSARPAVDVMSGQGLGERDGSALGYRATYPQLSHSMNAPAVSLAATRRT